VQTAPRGGKKLYAWKKHTHGQAKENGENRGKTARCMLSYDSRVRSRRQQLSVMGGKIEPGQFHAWQMTVELEVEVEVFKDLPRLKCNDAAITVGQGCASDPG